MLWNHEMLELPGICKESRDVFAKIVPEREFEVRDAVNRYIYYGPSYRMDLSRYETDHKLDVIRVWIVLMWTGDLPPVDLFSFFYATVRDTLLHVPELEKAVTQYWPAKLEDLYAFYDEGLQIVPGNAPARVMYQLDRLIEKVGGFTGHYDSYSHSTDMNKLPYFMKMIWYAVEVIGYGTVTFALRDLAITRDMAEDIGHNVVDAFMQQLLELAITALESYVP
jgi:hypothetical protein